MESGYDPAFFADQADKARRSAGVIVPLVLDLVTPASVVDLGCGSGSWLAEFERRGVADYLGVDGDWVPPELLEIPRERFRAARLDRPLELGRRFDLAVSLEVAEHLPELAARTLVRSAAALAPCVLFSAAVPHQGGLHHVNEQWPEYWAGLFAEHGYLVIDAIRPRIWTTPDVAYWYRQNTFIYALPEVVAAHPSLASARDRTNDSMLSIVHPRLLNYVAGSPTQHVRRKTARELSLREVAQATPHVVTRSLRFWISRRFRRGA